MRKNQSRPVRRRVNISGASNFSRSQTISSIVANKKAEREIDLQRQKSQARLRRRQRLYVAGFLIFALFVLTVLLMLQYAANITTVKYDSSESSISINDEKYRKIANEYLAAHPSDRLDFLRQEGNFENFMIKSAPEIDKASLAAEPLLGGRLNISFRNPVAVWESPEGRQYVDSTGHIFSENYMLEPSVVIKDESGLNLEGVQTVAPSSFLSFIGRVISKIDAEPGLGKVENVILPLGSIRYVEFHIAGRPYAIKAQTIILKISNKFGR